MTFEEFQQSREHISAHGFGELIGDAQWENDHETHFLVYDDCWYIEITHDGRYMLTLENRGWITDENTPLEMLERELFEFQKHA